MDFKVENLQGEDVLTMLYAVEGYGVIVDKHYNIKENVTIGVPGKTLNMHGFHVSDNGQHFLFVNRNVTTADRKVSATVPFEGECKLTTDGFREVDARTGKTLFEWDSTGRIAFNESTLDLESVEDRCSQFWDYLWVYPPYLPICIDADTNTATQTPSTNSPTATTCFPPATPTPSTKSLPTTPPSSGASTV